MHFVRNRSRRLALASLLLAGCAELGAEDLGAEDDLASDEYAATATAPVFTSLQSTPQGMRLVFTATDPAIARLSLFKMDREVGAYQRGGGVPVSPTRQYSVDDANVVLGHEYCYIVAAYAADQTRGSNSNALCAFHTGGTGVQPPAAPTGLRIDRVRERNLRIAFEDASSDETQFTLERGEGNAWVTVATLPAAAGAGTTLRHTDGDLDTEQRYCYRVRAHNANGASLGGLACGSTGPLAISDPVVVDDRPVIVDIQHPAAGTLLVTWHDSPGQREWTVNTFDGFATASLSSQRVRDNRPTPLTRQAVRIEGREPGKLFCFTMSRGNKTSGKLCEAPRAPRTSADQRDPRPEVTPSLASIDSPRNGALRVAISNPQPGQVLERILSTSGERLTRRVDTAGAAELGESNLTPGVTFCYRLFVFNSFGSRYSNILCAAPAANPPGRPSNLRVTSQEGEIVRLAWDAADDAESYEVSFDGTPRPNYQDHDGTKTASGTSLSFDGHEGYGYCFRARAKNPFGTSGWSNEVCVRLADDNMTSYGTSLSQLGSGSVLFGHTVSPGGGTARLTEVAVAGNGFTPYVVQFLPPGSSSAACGGSAGVRVEPGSSLTGSGLMTLYGSSQPTAPVALVACKLVRADGGNNLNAMPIQVTYQR